MYMISMIGMAILAVPRGVVRLLTWLVMGAAGWCLAGVEKAYATVSYNWNPGTATLTINGDGSAETIIVGAIDNDSVVFWDGTTPTTVTDGMGVPVEPSQVNLLYVNGNGGSDSLNVSGVRDDAGFFADPYVQVQGGSGNDWIQGIDDVDIVEDLYGGDGNDTLVGDAGADQLVGDDGADSLSGGAGDDLLYHYTIAQGTNSDGDQDTISGGTGSNFIQRNTVPDNDQ
jgi:Ca2+-binding RTX toxin-like protein